MPVIRIGGKAKAKPATTSKTRTTSSKRSSAKRGTATPAKKRSTAAKKTTRPARKGPGSQGGPGSRGPRTPKIAKNVLDKHVAALRAAGKERKDAEKAHDKAVEGVHKAAQAAMKAEVPMSIISAEIGVSRQWLYKMGQFKERTNGSQPTATSATRRGSKKKSGGGTKTRPRVRSKR